MKWFFGIQWVVVYAEFLAYVCKEQHFANGYELLYTLKVANGELWKTSSHVDFYEENMFDMMQVKDGQYEPKPMNCSFNGLVYKEGPRSYD